MAAVCSKKWAHVFYEYAVHSIVERVPTRYSDGAFRGALQAGGGSAGNNEKSGVGGVSGGPTRSLYDTAQRAGEMDRQLEVRQS